MTSTTSTNVLNPTLYHMLSMACRPGRMAGFGLQGGEVKITNQGHPMVGSYVQDFLYKSRPGEARTNTPRFKLNIADWGESYNVCCPYCGDLRHRLKISHRFNVHDAIVNSRNLHLIHCFNEGCHQEADFRDLFFKRIDLAGNSMMNIHAAPSMRMVAPSDAVTRPVELPGSLTPVGSLDKTHPARVFLESRGYNVRKLSEYFKIGLCTESRVRMARNRVIVPIYKGGALQGWQGRYIGETGDGNCKKLYSCTNNFCEFMWRHEGEDKPQTCPSCNSTEYKPRAVPKWISGTGTKLGQTLYNYDNARTYNFSVVVEGPMDAVKVGSPTQGDVPGPAVSVFNHILTAQQRNLLHSTWAARGPVFLMFDDDVFDETIEQYKELSMFFPKGLCVVQLPRDSDPGDLEHAHIWQLISDAAKRDGINRVW